MNTGGERVSSSAPQLPPPSFTSPKLPFSASNLQEMLDSDTWDADVVSAIRVTRKQVSVSSLRSAIKNKQSAQSVTTIKRKPVPDVAFAMKEDIVFQTISTTKENSIVDSLPNANDKILVQSRSGGEGGSDVPVIPIAIANEENADPPAIPTQKAEVSILRANGTRPSTAKTLGKERSDRPISCWDGDFEQQGADSDRKVVKYSEFADALMRAVEEDKSKDSLKAGNKNGIEGSKVDQVKGTLRKFTVTLQKPFGVLKKMVHLLSARSPSILKTGIDVQHHDVLLQYHYIGEQELSLRS
ncbi:hypothetical protein BT69DRAFT_87780 [Atractiella rhizophila]|nr:hypothetical protein BT69DRAFT_87780 [Atractiella rhizophila]